MDGVSIKALGVDVDQYTSVVGGQELAVIGKCRFFFS